MQNRIAEEAVMYGQDHLSLAEVLSLATGVSLDILQQIINDVGDVHRLAHVALSKLQEYPGIGPAAALRIKSCLEWGRRWSQVELRPGVVLNGSEQVFNHFAPRLEDLKQEHFYVILLDAKHRLIRQVLISVGSLNFSIVHPREIFRPALLEGAAAIILIHNHPSGDPAPSREDIYVTRRLVDVGETHGVEIIDHIVIGNGCYISFKEQKLL